MLTISSNLVSYFSSRRSFVLKPALGSVAGKKTHTGQTFRPNIYATDDRQDGHNKTRHNISYDKRDRLYGGICKNRGKQSKRSLALGSAGVSGLPIFRDFQFNT